MHTDTKEMTTLEFTEQVDKKALEYILRNHSQYDIWAFKSNVINPFGKKDLTPDALLTVYTNYLNQLDEQGRVTIQYLQKAGMGRYWPQSMGLTSMCRRLRHTIAKRDNIDLDIKNCHPTFALTIGKGLSGNYPRLEEYLQNRAQVLFNITQQVSGEFDAKQYILKLLNGGAHKLPGIQYLNAINKEFEDLRNRVCVAFPKLVALVKSKKTDNNHWNLKGRVLHHMLEDMENGCLQVMIQYFEEEKVGVTSLAYDGLTIERTLETEANIPRYCEEMSSRIKEQHGYELEITEKQMTEGFDLSNVDLDIQGSNPLQLLRQRYSNIPKCKCALEHSKMFKVIDYLYKTLKIKDIRDEKLTDLGLFIRYVVDVDCLTVVLGRICMHLPEMDTHLLEFAQGLQEADPDPEFNWEWVNQHVKPKAKDCVDVRVIIYQMLNTGDELELKTQSANDFKEEDDVYDMVDYFTQKVFPNRDAVVKEFVERFDRYIKLIMFPKCLVLNHGEGNVTVERDIVCETLYKDKDSQGREMLTSIRLVSGGLSTDIRVYKYLPLFEKVTFDPSGNHKKKEFNMYTGFKAKRVDQVNMTMIQPILDHMRDCWADGNDNLFDYIKQWFRHSFTEPWNKTQVVILLYGLEGTGKGILLDNLIIPKVYGEKMACVSQGLAPITQRFNSICMDKLLIVCNEVSTEEGWMNSFDKLKAIITDKTISIEKKGIDVFKDYPNHLNLIMTTNNHNSVRVGRTDRRYLCLETSDRFKSNHEYFQKLIDTCTQEVANHFFTYICDLDRTRNIKDIPMTQLKEEMSGLAKSTVERFIDDVREEKLEPFPPTMVFTHIDAEKWDTILKGKMYENIVDGVRERWCPARDLFQAYKKWAQENGEKAKDNTHFGIEAKNLLEHKKTKRGLDYRLPS
jgi:hypothetical protein